MGQMRREFEALRRPRTFSPAQSHSLSPPGRVATGSSAPSAKIEPPALPHHGSHRRLRACGPYTAAGRAHTVSHGAALDARKRAAVRTKCIDCSIKRMAVECFRTVPTTKEAPVAARRLPAHSGCAGEEGGRAPAAYPGSSGRVRAPESRVRECAKDTQDRPRPTGPTDRTDRRSDPVARCRSQL